ncbi:hypothetical protein AVEN_82090-1, partial [Araneus ventricosus]
MKLIPGRDGRVRVVEVSTGGGSFLPPIQRLYPLEGFLINFEISFMNFLYFDFCHSTVFPDFLFIMKRASSESASSPTPAKKPSTFNNTGGFTADSIPQHHYHLGENNYAVVSDFGNVLNVHIRKFKTNENGRIFPTKNGVSFSLYVWESLVTEMDNSSLPSETGKVVIICDTLFLTSAWIENVPCVSLQRYVTKQDFSRQFLPSVCLLTETEWNQLQCIRKKIS